MFRWIVISPVNLPAMFDDGQKVLVIIPRCKPNASFLVEFIHRCEDVHSFRFVV